MTQPAKPLEWDIFCNVIDNLGDIGVCWRLSRQLTVEYDCRVRLWAVSYTHLDVYKRQQLSYSRVKRVRIIKAWQDLSTIKAFR